MSRVDYGTVEVVLGGDSFTLTPTLNAMRAIKMRWPDEGIQDAIQACRSMDADDLAFIVAAGAGMDSKEAKSLPDKVFSAGVGSVAPDAVKYLMLLLNPSGRTDYDEDEEQGE